MEWPSDDRVRLADSVRAINSKTGKATLLNGLESPSPFPMDVYTAPQSDDILDITYDTDRQFLALMHQVIAVKGNLRSDCEPKFLELNNLGIANEMAKLVEITSPKTSECPAAGAGFFASARAQPTVGGQGF